MVLKKETLEATPLELFFLQQDLDSRFPPSLPTPTPSAVNLPGSPGPVGLLRPQASRRSLGRTTRPTTPIRPRIGVGLNSGLRSFDAVTGVVWLGLGKQEDERRESER